MHWWTDTINTLNWYQPFTVQGKQFVSEALMKINVIVNASAVIFRKAVVKNNIKFICNYKMCGDWLFWALLLKDNEIIYSPTKMNFFRNHNGTTRDNLTSEQKMRRVLEEISVKQQIQYLIIDQQIDQLKSNWKDILLQASFNKYIYLNSLINSLHINAPKFYKTKFLYYSLKRFIILLLQSVGLKN